MKVRDKIRITGNTCHHFFKIGQVVEVTKIHGDFVEARDLGNCWSVTNIDYELVDSPVTLDNGAEIVEGNIVVLHSFDDDVTGYVTRYGDQLVANFIEVATYSVLKKGNDYIESRLKKVYYGLEKDITGWCSSKVNPANLKWERVDNEVKLTEEYTAVVFKDKVMVGCQAIPLDKIREILDTAEKIAGKE